MTKKIEINQKSSKELCDIILELLKEQFNIRMRKESGIYSYGPRLKNLRKKISLIKYTVYKFGK